MTYKVCYRTVPHVVYSLFPSKQEPFYYSHFLAFFIILFLLLWNSISGQMDVDCLQLFDLLGSGQAVKRPFNKTFYFQWRFNTRNNKTTNLLLTQIGFSSLFFLCKCILNLWSVSPPPSTISSLSYELR